LVHASITTTLNTYTHLFDHAEHAKTVIERLETGFAAMLATPATAMSPVAVRQIGGIDAH
jgi:hypothetical protein